MRRMLVVSSLVFLTLISCVGKITVEPLPKVAKVSITLPVSAVSLKVGETQRFTADATNAEGDISWSDAGAGGSFNPATGSDVVYTPPLAAGTYTVTAKVSNSNNEATDQEQVTVIDPLPADETLGITANEGNGDPNTPLKAAITLAGNTSRVFQIDIPNATKAALVVELDQPLNLSLYSNDGFKTLFASSSSANFFAPGEAGLASKLASQGIGISVACRGSCVYQSATGVTRVFAKVSNQNASQVTFNLFAYVDDFGDTAEPANDAAATASDLGAGNAGALETLNDVDFYKVTQAGTLRFIATTTVVSPRAQILDASNNLLATLETGQIADVTVGTIVKVFSSNARAAASSVSRYSLTIE